MEVNDLKEVQTYDSLEQIRVRKEQLLTELRNDDKQMKNMWNSLFHKPAATSNIMPSKRINALMTTSVGIFDATLLAWKLYRKFKKKKRFF